MSVTIFNKIVIQKTLIIILYLSLIAYGALIYFYIDESKDARSIDSAHTEELIDSFSKGRLCCDDSDENYIQYLEQGMVMILRNSSEVSEESLWLLSEFKHYILLVIITFFVQIVLVIKRIFNLGKE